MSSTDLKPFVLTGQITTLSFDALKDNEKDALIAAWPDTASDATYLSFGNTLYRLEDFTTGCGLPGGLQSVGGATDAFHHHGNK